MNSLQGLHRRDDAETSIAAAERVSKKLNESKQRVLDAFRRFGPMTDQELREQPCLAGMAFSSPGKRRGELEDLGLIIKDGDNRRKRQQVYKLKPASTGRLF